MGATGLAADPTEYRSRLGDQEDAQLDAWAAELLRDPSFLDTDGTTISPEIQAQVQALSSLPSVATYMECDSNDDVQ